MKTICFVNTAYIKNTIGGAEVQMYLLAKAFHSSGWNVFYASEDVEETSEDVGIKLVPLKKSKNKKFDYNHFCGVLNDIDADIYYQRGRKALTYYLSKFCRQYNKKFVYAASMDIDTKRFKQASRLKPQKPLSFIKNIAPAIINDYKTLKGIKNATCVLAQTNRQKHAFKKHRGIPSEVIRNISLPNIGNEKKKEQPAIVLWVANIKKWKQPELFIKLAKDLKNSNCQFIMAGDLRDKSYLSIIKNSANDNFRFLGRIEYLESNELFSKASIFINTSLHYEGQPNSYIQAWLNEVPVVALNHDPDNVIKSNNLGFHSGSYEQLVSDVKKLIENPDLRTQMGKRAKQFAEETYSRKNFEQLLKLIDDLIAS